MCDTQARKNCPICGRPADERLKPFCSKRCADVDLHRWLSGSYAMDDIEVVSAHVQDARVRVGEIFWQPHDHRFVMALNRFDWMTAVDAKPEDKADYRRCRTALRFERVLACKCRGLDQNNKAAELNLLAVEFIERDAPGGTVNLTFSCGGAIRLDVECLEAELADLGEVFTAELCPDHFAGGALTA